MVQSKRMKVCEYSEVSSGEKLSVKAWDTELKKKKQNSRIVTKGALIQ